jgi:hypothetical protein
MGIIIASRCGFFTTKKNSMTSGMLDGLQSQSALMAITKLLASRENQTPPVAPRNEALC